RDVAIATFQIGSDDQIVQVNRENGFKWAPGKWRRNWHASSPKNNNNTDVNAVLLRYSDVLLMRAEAENEINGPDAAIPWINRVRERAFGNTSGNYTSAQFGGSKDLFFAKLKDERARELCFEPVGRRADLIRWNLLGNVLLATRDAISLHPNGDMPSFSYATPAERFRPGVHEIYPIPSREIRENRNLKQNNGY
ncbi:MAG: RagB/SusD family nutrient uptake outer membrane protein, partial [Prevotellaceae bacterium]|nr:RagB/SusD family nutrient uptake outer membrane protein [Prevotellaceae bacterium]